MPFRRIKFPTVFRSQPLPSPSRSNGASSPLRQMASPNTKMVTYNINPKSTASTSPKAVHATLNSQKENNSWAAVSRSSVAPVIDISTKKTAAKERVYIVRNRKNQRLDIPIPRVSPDVIKTLEEKKIRNGANFCNKYHLLGFCRGEAVGTCRYVHGDRLKGAELDALRLRARALPCSSGPACEDPWCISGHHCANTRACFFNEDCRFYDSHGMDTVSAEFCARMRLSLTCCRPRPLRFTRTESAWCSISRRAERDFWLDDWSIEPIPLW